MFSQTSGVSIPANSRFHETSALARVAHEPKRYVTKARIAFVSLAVCLHVGDARAQDKWPPDVARFIERRDLCDHFRGEEPYDAERRKFLEQKLNELCPGTDKELARLKVKYRDDRKTMAVLDRYEPEIEAPAR